MYSSQIRFQISNFLSNYLSSRPHTLRINFPTNSFATPEKKPNCSVPQLLCKMIRGAHHSPSDKFLNCHPCYPEPLMYSFKLSWEIFPQREPFLIHYVHILSIATNDFIMWHFKHLVISDSFHSKDTDTHIPFVYVLFIFIKSTPFHVPVHALRHTRFFLPACTINPLNIFLSLPIHLSSYTKLVFTARSTWHKSTFCIFSSSLPCPSQSCAKSYILSQ